MDILAHALWAGAGVTLARRRWPQTSATVAATVVLAVLPDVLHMLPIVAWWLGGDGTWATLRAYAVAVPGPEPLVTALVDLWSQHLHCVMHSAVVAGVVTLLLWAVLRRLWVPLLGWWSHIVIDVFTHSAEYYPVQVLYPLSASAFDGLAWNTPWFLAVNYAALAATWLWILRVRRRHHAK